MRFAFLMAGVAVLSGFAVGCGWQEGRHREVDGRAAFEAQPEPAQPALSSVQPAGAATRADVETSAGARWDTLFAAVCAVESGNNPRAVGDGGRAAGIVQMWKVTVDDCNRIAGMHRWRHRDRFDAAKCREMFRVYLEHYCGPNASFERCARVWNGGPNGCTKPETLGYWTRVRAELERASANGN